MTQGTGARVPDAAIPAFLALALHLRTLAFGLVDLDDRDLLVDDRAFLASPGSVWRAFGRSYMGVVDLGHAYFRPIVTASYAIDTGPGAGAWRYHLTNVLLHCAVAALACEVLRSLRFSRGASVAAACAIAVHPALVPAVAWIPGRNDGLLAVFGLAAWLAFARGSLALHLVCLAAALFTKETAFAIPLVCVAHAILAPSAAQTHAQGTRLGPAYIAGVAVLVVVRLAVRRSDLALAWSDPATVARVFLAALGHLVLPVDPAPIYASSDLRLAPGIAAVIALAWATWRVPGVRRGIVALGAAVFGAVVLPVAIAGGSLFLDNRLLLPAVGVAIAVVEIGQAVLRETGTRVAATAAVLIGFAVVSAGYEGAFAGARPFALAAVAWSPRCALARVCLGRSYQGAGEDDRALAEYEEALRLAPAEIAHNNIAVIYMKRGQWDAAARELDAELTLNPGYARAYFNRAIVLRREGRSAEACADARRAAALSSDPGRDDLLAEREKDCARPESP
ncbi:MAG: tetratricopeptide repeat protein [Polyangiaceae bacterium]